MGAGAALRRACGAAVVLLVAGGVAGAAGGAAPLLDVAGRPLSAAAAASGVYRIPLSRRLVGRFAPQRLAPASASAEAAQAVASVAEISLAATYNVFCEPCCSDRLKTVSRFTRSHFPLAMLLAIKDQVSHKRVVLLS